MYCEILQYNAPTYTVCPFLLLDVNSNFIIKFRKLKIIFLLAKSRFIIITFVYDQISNIFVWKAGNVIYI